MKASQNRLRVVRAERRVTQQEIAAKTQKRITQTRVSRIENGYDEPTDREKQLLAKVLKTPVQEIFPDVESEQVQA